MQEVSVVIELYQRPSAQQDYAAVAHREPVEPPAAYQRRRKGGAALGEVLRAEQAVHREVRLLQQLEERVIDKEDSQSGHFV